MCSRVIQIRRLKGSTSLYALLPMFCCSTFCLGATSRRLLPYWKTIPLARCSSLGQEGQVSFLPRGTIIITTGDTEPHCIHVARIEAHISRQDIKAQCSPIQESIISQHSTFRSTSQTYIHYTPSSTLQANSQNGLHQEPPLLHHRRFGPCDPA